MAQENVYSLVQLLLRREDDMAERKYHRKDKDSLLSFDAQVKDIRLQLNDQLRCLDMRLENQLALATEIQDYFRRRAEVELEYSRSLEKLSRSLTMRHKAEKQRREQWPLFSSYACWQHLVNTTRRQSHDHAVLHEIYSTHLVTRLTHIMEDVQLMYKRCREIGIESHEELLKVLHELHTTMKTYQTYHAEERQAESKLRYVEAQRSKLEQSIPREKLEKSKKFRLIEKEIQKRQSKFNDASLKALKARNDYVLCMDASNAAVHKYFVDDLSDLIDCMDFGFHTCFARTLMMYVSSEECMKKSRQSSIDGMNKCITSLDSRADKQRFLECNNSAFMVPKKFVFHNHKGDEIKQVSSEKSIQEDLEQRLRHLNQRLTSLKIESDEIWKTLETAERSLLDMITSKDYDSSSLFEEDGCGRNGLRTPETLTLKLRADRQETEDFYVNKFREYTLGSNLIARLQAKADILQQSLGSNDQTEIGSSSPASIHRPNNLPQKPRKKRIGRTPLMGQPKLFGGSLEEYVEITNQEIPLVIRSCIRIINLYGLHHQGVFRVSGSQVEINNFRDTFERGEDPLAEMTDASDINSVAGVLKLYLRELREPLFPIFYFDQLVEISKLESKSEFICKTREVVQNLSRSVFIVLRYLFAFLNHLSEFSDENMMDPYNLAICFGPTLLPIPEDRDQVQYQNQVNELVKNIIIYQEEIFSNDGGILYEKYISTNVPDENDVGESPPEQGIDQVDDSDVIPVEDDVIFREREISLNLFGKTEVLEAVAQFDFSARSKRELSFKRGDSLLLYSQVSNDWWKGSVDGCEGLIPDKYILLKIKDEDKDKLSIDSGGERRRTSSSSDSLSGVSHSPKSYSTEGILEEQEDACDIRWERSRKTSFHSTIPSSSSSTPGSQISSPQFPETKIRRRSFSPSSMNKLKVAGDVHLDQQLSTSASIIDITGHEITTEHGVDLLTYEPVDDDSNQKLAKHLDTTLAKVYSSITSLEKSRQTPISNEKKYRLPSKDAPDLVLDLPVNPSSPITGPRDGKDMLEHPQTLSRSSSTSSGTSDMTAAERFALTSQCTMRKGAAISGDARSVTTSLHSHDAQTQTFPQVKRSTSTSVTPPQSPNLSNRVRKLRLSSSTDAEIKPPKVPDKPFVLLKKDLKDISPDSHISPQEKTAKNETGGASVGVQTVKPPPVKAKPPVMKKPLHLRPSPEPVRRIQERDYKQTSC